MSPGRGSRVLMVAMLVAASALAGCTQPSGPQAAKTISAQQALETIGTEAERWQPDAELVLISGVEAGEGSVANREVPNAEGRSTPAAPVDGDVGDGRAPTWTTLYYSEAANETRSFRFTPDGIVDTGPSDPPSETPTRLANWSVDSPNAVGSAMGNDTFRRAALSEDGTVIMTLGMRQGAPVWQLIARSASNSVHAQVQVDATDGSIVAV